MTQEEMQLDGSLGPAKLSRFEQGDRKADNRGIDSRELILEPIFFSSVPGAGSGATTAGRLFGTGTWVQSELILYNGPIQLLPLLLPSVSPTKSLLPRISLPTPRDMEIS
jgi:hypothetical protein